MSQLKALTNEVPVQREPNPQNPWADAVDEIAADAHGRAESYPSESLVPEGGE